MYKAKVKYNGEHYFCGEIVRGSKIDKLKDGSTWLYDDEEIDCWPYYGEARNVWVQIDESTLEEEENDQK